MGLISEALEKLCERCHADELKHDVDSHNVELPQRRQILAGGGSLAATGLQRPVHL